METYMSEIESTSSSHPDGRFSRGCAMFQQVFGFPAQTFLDSLEAISPDFARYIMEWEFADTYSRTALNPRERELVVLAACAALGATGAGPLKLHIEAARRVGIDKDTIAEIFIQVGFAAGVPAALNAMQIAQGVFAATPVKAAGI